MPPRKRDEPTIEAWLVNFPSGSFRWITYNPSVPATILMYGWSDGQITWKAER